VFRRARVTVQRHLVPVVVCVQGKAMQEPWCLVSSRQDLAGVEIQVAYGRRFTVEACFRRMKTTGLRIRPVYHWTAHRIASHVKLCVLALLLQRAAEIRTGDTWRNIRLVLEEIQPVRYRVGGTTIVQSTHLTAQARTLLKKLHVAPRRTVLLLSGRNPAEHLATRLEKLSGNTFSFLTFLQTVYYDFQTRVQLSGSRSG
jgi:hypothetical protein